MKYLKLFESFTIRILPVYNKNLSLEEFFGKEVLIGTDREQTLREICLELEDEGYNIDINRWSNKNNDIVLTHATDERSGWCREAPANWDVIKEYLLRIKDYLGDDYIDCEYLDFSKSIEWVKITLSKKTKIDRIDSIVIHYKDNTYE